MDLLSRLWPTGRRRHQHLTYLSSRIILCTLPSNSSPRDAQKLVGVLHANHESDTIMVVQVNSPCVLPGIPSAIHVSLEGRTLEGIVTVCRPLRSWLQSSPTAVAVLHMASEECPMLASCVLLECDPQYSSFDLVAKQFVRLCAIKRVRVLTPGKNPLPSEYGFLQNFDRFRKRLDVQGLSALCSPVELHSVTLLTIPKYGRVILPKNEPVPPNVHLMPTTVRAFVMIVQNNEVIFNSLITERAPRTILSDVVDVTFDLRGTRVSGDFLCKFYHRRSQGPPKLMFAHYMNSAFMDATKETLTVGKGLIDKASIDERYNAGFGLRFGYRSLPTPDSQPPTPIASPTTASSSIPIPSASQAAASAVPPDVAASPQLGSLTRQRSLSMQLERLSLELGSSMRTLSDLQRLILLEEEDEDASREVADSSAQDVSGADVERKDDAAADMEHWSDDEPAAVNLSEEDQITSDYELARMLQHELFVEATRDIRQASEDLKGDLARRTELGPVHIGLLPVTQYKVSMQEKRNGVNECQVCRYQYEAGEQVRTLPCFHIFHTSCIDPWLIQKPQCPICLTKLSVMADMPE